GVTSNSGILDPSSDDYIAPPITVKKDTSEKEYSFEFEINNIPDDDNENVAIVLDSVDYNGNFSIKDVELVRESSATGSLSDWTYRGTTFIDGGNIYTDTIHTDHIKSLDADKIVFENHIFGKSATFKGDLEGSSYTAEETYIKDGAEF